MRTVKFVRSILAAGSTLFLLALMGCGGTNVRPLSTGTSGTPPSPAPSLSQRVFSPATVPFDPSVPEYQWHLVTMDGIEFIALHLNAQGKPLYEEEHEPTIPYAKVTVTATETTTGAMVTKELVPIFGEHGFHYGNNLSLAAGHYRLIVRVDPPTFHRHKGFEDRWLKPIVATFTWHVE